MRILAVSARSSESRERALPPITAPARVGLGSRAVNGMASTEPSSDAGFGVMMDSPYKQGAPNELNSLQAPAVRPVSFGGSTWYSYRIVIESKAPVGWLVVFRVSEAVPGHQAPPARMCGLRCVNSLKRAEKFYEFP
jgi:hypothetical protein